jgi:ubiquinone/menaquinone biosynthesis C-methylase UbiE
MLPRVLEPEVMDSPAEAADYDSMDHSEVNRRFVDGLLAFMAHRFDSADSGQIAILDLGTGTAQIPIELCRRADRVQIVAVDAASHMLDLARRNVAAAGFVNRIQLEQADAKRLRFPNAGFDGVMSNSIAHHLPEPIACLKEAVRVTRPGGFLFFRDLLRPADAAELVRLVDQYAPAAGISPALDHQRAMFADSLHAALTLDEIRALAVQLGFQPISVQTTSDRHWTWSAQKPIV